MIKRGKYYLDPPKDGSNFKELFQRQAAAGAGRAIDNEGVPKGPWTPELLADAISQLDANHAGIELRTVQRWFQDNEMGVSTENIRWLSRVFGCGDPEATSEWQAELSMAQSRLTAKRRESREKKIKSATEIEQARSISTNNAGINLALRSEAMFAGPNSLNLPIVIWGGLGVLWFLAFSLGVHSVTYSPSDGINKQVGFIWSPGWNIGEAIFLPMFLITVSGLLNSWKRDARLSLIKSENIDTTQSWHSKVNSFWLSFWAVLLICLIVIFLMQWAGVYLFPLLKNNPDVVMIDWILIALVRPEVLSTNAAIFVSFLGFLYSGIIYWFLFTGLLLLYTMAGDFSEICASTESADDDNFRDRAFTSGTTIMQGIFRCTILGILIALTIKVNAAYLVSDAEGIITWLLHDASLAIGLRDDEWTWINGSPSPFFTSFLLLFLICFIFGACLKLIKNALDEVIFTLSEKRHTQLMWFRMTLVVFILAAGYMLVGQFFGFSIVLIFSITISIVSLFWRTKPLDSETQGI